MSDKPTPNKVINEEETPDWLKTIQLNSWEAELLISALFLYILFQIPDIIENYRLLNFNRSDMTFRFLGMFKSALQVLSIGYVIHIMARGIWVANVGLSYVFPKGVNVDRLKLKGRFKKEVESGKSLNNSILGLERFASMTYAISFISSALMLSFGMCLMLLIVYFQYVFEPSMKLSSGSYYLWALLGLLIYLLILLLIFIDFITNGFFRRDSWASKPYYYLMIVFRVITLSFIYNRMLLAIVSNLPRWQAHLIPIGFVLFLIGFNFLEDRLEDSQLDAYYEDSFDNMRYNNYESMRKEKSALVVTIQDDIIDENVIRLFVNDSRDFSAIHKLDRERQKEWKEFEDSERALKTSQYLKVVIDSTPKNDLKWFRYKHPETLSYGYLTYVTLDSLSIGDHLLQVHLDTAALNEKQKEFVIEMEPSHILRASIPFHKLP